MLENRNNFLISSRPKIVVEQFDGSIMRLLNYSIAYLPCITYSRVPNKRTGRLLENEKKSHLYALIRNYTFINFQLKVLPIRLFSPIFILFFQICLRKYVSHWYMKQKKGFLRVDLGFLGLLSLCKQVIVIIKS